MPINQINKIQQSWWKEAVAYQIYPRSFMDSNGDGIGDIQGIISKLDYLNDLGIDLIWICPIFKSPNDDNGYDISDYQDIMAEFGTLADFEQLLDEVHQRGMKLILDLVVNHTSDEHPWFLESRASVDNEKRDWYIWRDGIDNHEPNNWESIFHGSVWEKDPLTEQYFFHLFSRRQPDLNWENAAMRKALYTMIRWWLDKGIDGFRLDAVSHIKKKPGLKDLPNPKKLDYVPAWESMMNVDGVLDHLDEMCKQTFNRYDIVTVGEANGVNPLQAQEWVGEEHQRLNMIFQFETTMLWNDNPGAELDLPKLKTTLNNWQQGLNGIGWNALFVENHDVPRVVSKWGDTKDYWYQSATAIATMYFMMQGTPFIYQGQELGMTNTQFKSIDDFDCIHAKNQYRQLERKGLQKTEIIDTLSIIARDNARTPMQWNSELNGGFSTGQPWLALNPNYVAINADHQQSDPGSILSFYKQLIQLRKSDPTLIYGNCDLLLKDDPQIYAYSRKLDNEEFLVIVNMSDSKASLAWFDGQLQAATMVLSNIAPHQRSNQQLLPFEARIYRL